MAIIIIYPAISCVFGTNHIMCSLINIHMPFFLVNLHETYSSILRHDMDTLT